MPNGRFVSRLGAVMLLLFWLTISVTTNAADNDLQSAFLSQYPLLSQKDPQNYRDQSLLTVQDSLPGGTGTAIVPNLACAATVYTMLDRGRGNLHAMIDDFYPDPRKYNGNSPGATRPPYVDGDVTLDQSQMLTSLKSGQPVVLHGFGGPLKQHFVLAVGFKTDSEGKQTLIALDPYPGNDRDKPGKQIELSLGAMPIVHPIYNSIIFKEMRLIVVDKSNSSSANGESIPMPVAYKTYTFTPGKFTGQELFLEKENLHCKIFCFDQYHAFPKPVQTVNLRIALRGGYRAHDLFGHDDFVPKEAQDVATGWVPQASGNFIIFPDESKQHLPMWIPERTRLIRVPLVKQYGDTVVNAYDIALGLDRFNQSDDKSVSIEFNIVEATDDSGKKGKRLIPANPLTDGVYFAYSLADNIDTDIYGFLFVVGMPSLEADSNVTQAEPSAPTTGIQPAAPEGDSEQISPFLKFPIKGEFDPWDAKISALIDHDLINDRKLKTFQGEGDEVTYVPGDKEGDNYFVKTDGSEFNLGELSNYQYSKKKFYYDGHLGYDYKYPADAIVIAADSGVLFISEMEKFKDYHAIVIKHDNGFVTYYLHLSKWDPKIEEYFTDPAKQNTRIQKGDVIGNPGGVGPTGPNNYGVHLHFGVHNAEGKVVDPYGEFTKSGTQVAPVLWEELPPSQRLK